MIKWSQVAKWGIVLTILAVNLTVGAHLYSKEIEKAADEDDSPIEMYTLFTTVIEQIRTHYVDEDKTTYKNLIEGALKGLLQNLDPHSQYMTEEAFKEMKEDTSGHFGGLGITIGLRDAVLTVISPMEDTPAFRAGLWPGDKIIEIDGESTDGITMNEALKKLRGEPGTKVVIKIFRPETQDINEHEIIRAIINVPSVKDARLLDGNIGYVRLVQFGEETSSDLQKELDKFVSQKVDGLILDLRGNPGGLLMAAVDVSRKFLKRNDLIVFTRVRGEKIDKSYRVTGRKRFPDVPMAILINGSSASASEIVAGALQDNKRAFLVGEKSFGKGSVQSVMPNEYGSAARMTTAKYYTPSEKVIHDNGIEPDIMVPMTTENWLKILRLRNQPVLIKKQDDGTAIEETDAPDADSPEEEFLDANSVEDAQLERAQHILQGILLFMGKDAK